MRTRYISGIKNRLYYLGKDEDGDPSMTADTIIVSDDEESQPTGLLDADGNEFYRMTEKIPFGFIHRR